MNIFYLDENPQKAAQYHCDKHVVKMILESAQILCTNYRLQHGIYYENVSVWANTMNKYIKKDWYLLAEDDHFFTGDTLYIKDYSIYKHTHTHHPCTIWAREEMENTKWLFELFFALCAEWAYRYNHSREHKSYQIIERLYSEFMLKEYSPNLDLGITTPALAMPEQYQSKDPVESYRNYYKGDKGYMLAYTRREEPEWVND